MKFNILKNIRKSVNLSSFSTNKNYQKLYSIVSKTTFCSVFNKKSKIPFKYEKECRNQLASIANFNFSSTCNTKNTETCTLSKLPTFEEIFQNTKDYYVEQISTGCLAQYAYYIESNGEAAIVDPMRETDVYLEILKKRGAKLKYILETHFHADFVSGHLELSKLTGAKIVFGPTAKTNLPVHVAEDGELLSLGKINLKVFHSPGHTLESSSFVLLNTEKQPKAMFTGDFLFLGEVGRPDLAVGGNLTKENLGELIYESIQRLKKEYTEDIVIFPGHGAGSACGKNISKGTCDTLKNQIKTNYALNDKLSKEEFVKIVTSNLPTPPQYFFHDAMLNILGAESVQEVLQEAYKGIKPENFVKIIQSDKNVKIIDTRDINKSKNFFLRGSYLVALNMNYAIFVANLCKPEDKILLITDPGQERESIIRLFRVGYDKILGFLDGNIESLKGFVDANQLVSIESTKPEEVKQKLEENSQEKRFEILDVREISEWESTGILPLAHLCSLSNVEKNIEQIKKDCQGKQIGIMCKTGGRATIAASIFKKHEINDVFVLGGYIGMKEKDVKFINYKNY